ncbi:MAG: hypothetical protein ACI87W_001440 [Halieaceae bacterium]|jgi:hypothetical protein
MPYMGADVVTDFEVGVDTHDTSALDSTASLAIVAGDTVITLKDGSSLTLQGVQTVLSGFNSSVSGAISVSGIAL